MLKIKLVLVLASLTLAGTTVQAAQNGDEGTGTSATTTGQNSSGENMNNQSNQQEDQNKQARNDNLMAGGIYLAGCYSKYCGGWCCFSAAVSFAQAAMNSGKAGENANIGDMTFSGGGIGGGPGQSTVANPGAIDVEIENGLAALAKKGFSVNKEDGTVTGPDGTVATGADFNTDAGKKKLGMTDANKDYIAGLQSKIMKKYKKRKKMRLASGGGGSRSPASSYDADKNAFDANAFMNSLRGKKKKPAKNIAGMATNHNGDMIGVAVDDIFKMIHRRYQNKRKLGSFVEKK